MPYFVSTHSRPKAAGPMMLFMFMLVLEFQHTAARRRLGRFGRWRWWPRFGFNTQPPEGGWGLILLGFRITTVFQHTAARRRLGNHAVRYSQRFFCFNTQPPEGGWAGLRHEACNKRSVSTHSRPKAAGLTTHQNQHRCCVSTHSRPKAAGAA